MTAVAITHPDGSLELYETSCPVWVYVETSDPFQDQDEMRAAYGGD